MALTITDILAGFSNQNVFSAATGNVVATPSRTPPFFYVGGVWYEAQYPYARTAAANPVTGSWTQILPWPSESDPSSMTWSVTLPDNYVWSGTVPEGVSGPLTLKQLKDGYSWAISNADDTPITGVSSSSPSFVWGSALSPTASGTAYMVPGFGAPSSTELKFEMTHTGSLSNMRVLARVGSAGGSVTYTVRKNAADTAMTITMAAAATGGTFTSSTVDFVAGDDISLSVTGNSGISQGQQDVGITVQFS